MNLLLSECEQVQEMNTEISARFLSNKYKPSNILHNQKALDIHTERFIPDDIKLGLGFGWKFLFLFSIDNNNLPSTLAQLEQCIEESIPILSQHEAGMNALKILKNHNAKIRDFLIQYEMRSVGWKFTIHNILQQKVKKNWVRIAVFHRICMV